MRGGREGGTEREGAGGQPWLSSGLCAWLLAQQAPPGLPGSAWTERSSPSRTQHRFSQEPWSGRRHSLNHQEAPGMQGPSSATGSALPKGLSQPLWSPRGLAGPPGLLPSLGSPPELLGAGGNKDPPEKRKGKSNITHWHVELLLERSGSPLPPAVGDMGSCPEGTRTWGWWGQAPRCPPVPWKLLGLMELQPP